MRKTVAFGFVGTVLDYAGRGSQRWSKWRPTLCLCQQESLVIDRLELLHDARSRSLFETLKRDIASVSPETEVVGVEIELHNPWDFEEVYACLHDFARGYAFQPEKEDYLIHITTGLTPNRAESALMWDIVRERCPDKIWLTRDLEPISFFKSA